MGKSNSYLAPAVGMAAVVAHAAQRRRNLSSVSAMVLAAECHALPLRPVKGVRNILSDPVAVGVRVRSADCHRR
jgi:hypothetical protein